MNHPEPVPAPAPAPVEQDMAHGPDHVHLYETSGITEGNRRVPTWLVVVFVSLIVFYFAYILLHWNAQPGTAKFR
jgi:hypothetical protein